MLLTIPSHRNNKTRNQLHPGCSYYSGSGTTRDQSLLAFVGATVGASTELTTFDMTWQWDISRGTRAALSADRNFVFKQYERAEGLRLFLIDSPEHECHYQAPTLCPCLSPSFSLVHHAAIMPVVQF